MEVGGDVLATKLVIALAVGESRDDDPFAVFDFLASAWRMNVNDDLAITRSGDADDHFPPNAFLEKNRLGKDEVEFLQSIGEEGVHPGVFRDTAEVTVDAHGVVRLHRFNHGREGDFWVTDARFFESVDEAAQFVAVGGSIRLENRERLPVVINAGGRVNTS